MDEDSRIGVLQKDLIGNGQTTKKADKVENEDDIDLEDLDLAEMESAKSDGQSSIQMDDIAEAVEQATEKDQEEHIGLKLQE